MLCDPRNLSREPRDVHTTLGSYGIPKPHFGKGIPFSKFQKAMEAWHRKIDRLERQVLQATRKKRKGRVSIHWFYDRVEVIETRKETQQEVNVRVKTFLDEQRKNQEQINRSQRARRKVTLETICKEDPELVKEVVRQSNLEV